jgi:REP element-mobilizing transposase RayT
MPSSHVSLTVHIVFSTKERLPWITPEIAPRLHAYIGGIIKGSEAVPIIVGGIDDHVHILGGLRSKHRLDYFVRDVKADSSKWLHENLTRDFEWQKGYGAFSVSPTAIDDVRNYIQNQAQHHKKEDFKSEYRRMLDRSGIVFDEEYLW